MLKHIIPVVATLFLAFPFTGFAVEHSFTQNGVKAVIKLTPDEPVVNKKVDLSLKVEIDGQPVTDRKVSLEVYEKERTEPALKREVDVLDGEYLDSWSFEKPGEHKVVLTIADPQKPGEALHYEVKASVDEKDAEKGHGDHGFFAHHFGGGKWGWWGGGLMLLMMVPMAIIML